MQPGGYRPPGAAGGGASNRSTFYVINGVFIMIWGGLITLGGLIRVVGMALVLMNEKIPPNATGGIILAIIGLLVSFLAGIIMVIGGISLIRQKGLSNAKSGAIIAAIPCFGCFVMPFGIWACILLFSPQAKQDFR